LSTRIKFDLIQDQATANHISIRNILELKRELFSLIYQTYLQTFRLKWPCIIMMNWAWFKTLF